MNKTDVRNYIDGRGHAVDGLDPTTGAAPAGTIAWTQALDNSINPPARCKFGPERCRFRESCTFYHGEGLLYPGIIGLCACVDYARCPRGHPMRAKKRGRGADGPFPRGGVVPS